MKYQPIFIIDDNQLSIYPSRPMIEKWLTYTEKGLVQEEGEADLKSTKRRVQVFWELPDKPGAIGTLPGLWLMLSKKCIERGWTPIIRDERIAFPDPDMSKVHDLYPMQMEVLEEGLAHGWSGIFSAPTRFGKSYLMANILRAYPGLKTAVLAPGKDLGLQLRDDLQDLVKRDFSVLGFGSRKRYQGDDVTICSFDSIEKLDHNDTRLVLVDEVHALVTGDIPWEPKQYLPGEGSDNEGRLAQFLKFERSRIYGFGATASGRFDNRDLLIEGVIGPVLAERSYTEAVEGGVIAPIKVLMCRVPYNVMHVNPRRRDWVYKTVVWNNDYMGRLVEAMTDRVIPPEWQTLMFIENEESALHFQKYMQQASIAMAKRLKAKERDRLMNMMARNEVARCLASKIYSQGVTFPDLRVVINLSGGGASTYAIQKPGRVAQIRPGKRCGVLIDFMFEGHGQGSDKAWFPHRDSKSRLKLYHERGYEVIRVDNISDFPTLFQQHCV